jgi:DNA-binding beta-propeller fold protein YncE/fibronectin type 3 domain-containing protein
MKKARLLLVLMATLFLEHEAAVAQFTNGQNANVVLGQPNFTTSTIGINQSGMQHSASVAVDPTTGKVFVSDTYNNRVLRFSNAAAVISGSAAEAVLGQPNLTTTTYKGVSQSSFAPFGVAVDASGNLYVADPGNNRVLRFANASSLANGSNATSVLGQPDFTSSFGIDPPNQSVMANPTGIAVDGSGNLYVADQQNNRVLRFANAASLSNGANATSVLGQATFTTGVGTDQQSSMASPTGVAVDGSGNLYVADAFNNRVLRFANAASLANGSNATSVLGQATFTTNTPATTQSGMYYPRGVAVDATGNLYVADNINSRVLQFANAASLPNGANATSVLGQATFTTNTSATTQSGMNQPFGVAVDGSGNLYVADTGNNRVLQFTNPASLANGLNANSVLGQATFTTNGTATTQSGMNAPVGIAVHPATGKVFVADYINNRVLRFSSTAAAISGSAAEAVLGQPDFTSNIPATTQSGMNNPYGVAVDASGNLYVSDLNNNRVLIFANAASLPNGANATSVLGQPVFTSNIIFPTNQYGMHYPRGLAVDNTGNLYVADDYNQRVLIFANAATLPNGALATSVLGQPDFNSNSSATSQSGMNSPSGVAVDAAGNLYVSDYGISRVLRFANAASLPNGAIASVVLGQVDFTTSGLAKTQNGMNYPFGVAVDASGNLYVADTYNNRILKFANAASLENGSPATSVLGQPSFLSYAYATTQSGMNTPSGVAVDASGNLYIADYGNNRVLRFNGPGPQLVSVTDVPNDQGGQLFILWNASTFDAPSNHLISRYSVWRAPQLTTGLGVPSNAIKGKGMLTSSMKNVHHIKGEYFEQVGTVTAKHFSGYSFLDHTPADSVIGATPEPYYDYIILAETADSNVFYPSNVVSGISVDNLPPGTPSAVAAQAVSNGIQLHWTPAHDPDIYQYNLYRSPLPFVLPRDTTGATVFVTSDTTYTDAVSGGQSYNYVVVTVDLHGNRSAMSKDVGQDLPLAVSLVSLTATPVEQTATKLGAGIAVNWATASETNNAGFEIYRKEKTLVGYSDLKLISSYKNNPGLKGLGSSPSGRAYSLSDWTPESGKSYIYELRDYYYSGQTASRETAEVKATQVGKYELGQNYPNPFNPTTTIEYAMPQAGVVTLKVYDVLGREVTTLVNERKAAGNYAVPFNGSGLASGVYFYKLTAGNFTATKKLLLVK